MSLPNLDLRHWEQLEEAEKQQHCCAYNMDQEKTNASRAASRVPIGTVAAYFQDYVVRQGLQQYFRRYLNFKLECKSFCNFKKSINNSSKLGTRILSVQWCHSDVSTASGWSES